MYLQTKIMQFFSHCYLPSAGAHAAQGGSFPSGTGSILLDDMGCTGMESKLFNCSGVMEEHDCLHSEDAGVLCEGLFYILGLVYSCG